MIENHPQESLLIRYADDCATPSERTEVEALIATDQGAAVFLQQLIQTDLPYAAAFDQTLQSAPEDLVSSIRSWQPQPSKTEQKRTFGIWSLAATLLAGALGGALLSGLFAKSSSDTSSIVNNATNAASEQTIIAQTNSAQPPEWVRLVADYHRLYIRETVDAVAAQSADSVSEHLTSLLNRQTRVPELSAHGIEFRRAQMLAVDGRKLIQLAYLPDAANPIAVCILATRVSANTDVTVGVHANMRYAHWQSGDHAVVIVGDMPMPKMQAVVDLVRKSLFENS